MMFMKIGCVLVLYNPEKEMLLDVLKSIVFQVDKVFIADNSCTPKEWFKSYLDKIIYQRMSGNIGIAAAQNTGIKYFIEKNYTHVLFLDQDSIAPYNLVGNLIEDSDFLIKNNYAVGAIGPRIVNRKSNSVCKGKVNKGTPLIKDITKISDIISSGSLVPIENFEKVGLMDEYLFIDGVDHEWCWRAAYNNKLSFFISEKTMLSHYVGEGDRYFLRIRIMVPTPFRIYYLYRSFLYLARIKYVPIYWKLSNAVKLFFKAFYFPIYVVPRLKYLKRILMGIIDGVRNR